MSADAATLVVLLIAVVVGLCLWIPDVVALVREAPDHEHRAYLKDLERRIACYERWEHYHQRCGSCRRFNPLYARVVNTDTPLCEDCAKARRR